MWREREWRGADAEYKLYEQFCNRAERPNCPAPSTRRMRSREMARSQFWTAWTSERWGTEVLVRSIYLFHSPHSNVPTFIPGTIDMCSRAKVPSFSTGHLHIVLWWACYPVAFVLKSVTLLWGLSTICCLCSQFRHLCSYRLCKCKATFCETWEIKCHGSELTTTSTAAIKRFPPVCPPPTMSVSCKRWTKFRRLWRIH